MAQLQDLLNKEVVNKLYKDHTKIEFPNLPKDLTLEDVKKNYIIHKLDYEPIEGDYFKDENGI